MQKIEAGSRVISLARVKAHLRVDLDIEDELITAYLDAAIDDAEKYMQRSVNQSGYRISMNAWPVRWFKICASPFAELESIKYKNAEGVETTLPEDQYTVKRIADGAIVDFVHDFEAPEIEEYVNGAVWVDFRAGYDSLDDPGDDPELHLPPAVFAAILLTTGHLYANRESVRPGQTFEVPHGAITLLDRYRIYR